jgi:hypothetical protein
MSDSETKESYSSQIWSILALLFLQLNYHPSLGTVGIHPLLLIMGDSEVKGRVVPGCTNVVRPGAIPLGPKFKKWGA